ncbi:MAG TPA: CARDB domain-containing protein, partial [Candidatus Thermoplasmatota archaeon]
ASQVVYQAVLDLDVVAFRANEYATSSEAFVEIIVTAKHDDCSTCVSKRALRFRPAYGEQLDEHHGPFVFGWLLSGGSGEIPAGRVEVSVELYAAASNRGTNLILDSNAAADAVGVLKKVLATVTPASGADPLPDLVVADLAVTPATARAGDAMQATAVVSNTGEAAATGFTVEFALDSQPIKSHLVSGLAAGASVTLSADWTATEGDHAVRVVADSESQVSEADETNNEATSSFVVSGPPVRAAALSPKEQSGTVPAKGSITYTVTVTNTGEAQDTILLSKAANADGWKATLSQTSVEVGPGASADVMLTVQAPKGKNAAGSFTVTVTGTSSADASAYDSSSATTSIQG